ncbi:hypothetical protein ACFL59_08240, partial [Planctomycetota bacterium]
RQEVVFIGRPGNSLEHPLQRRAGRRRPWKAGVAPPARRLPAGAKGALLGLVDHNRLEGAPSAPRAGLRGPSGRGAAGDEAPPDKDRAEAGARHAQWSVRSSKERSQHAA